MANKRRTIVAEWMLIIGVLNLGLFIAGILLFLPRKVFSFSVQKYLLLVKQQLPYLLLIIGVVAIHIVEVNIVDSYVTSWIGTDFASLIHGFENGAVFWFSQQFMNPILTVFFVLMYIGVYPFTLWFSPFYFLLAGEKKAMKNLAYGLALIYAVALPFYLFVPITNVYTFYGAESTLESVIPSIESFFYATTTQNNCLPSLHVAMTLLVAWSAHIAQNKRYMYFTYFCAISVIVSVMYLAIHWITDVICGALLAGIIILGLNHVLKEE